MYTGSDKANNRTYVKKAENHETVPDVDWDKADKAERLFQGKCHHIKKYSSENMFGGCLFKIRLNGFFIFGKTT